ncbi:MAG: hypothetical protein U1E84_10235 [Rhodoferax sp.]
MPALRRPDPTGADWPWLVLVVLVAALYLLGLDSPYAPTNGDEMVYIHIARKTAETGHWLPLASDIVDTRNTKPPLLFWQAMVAGDWGAHWSLFALRLPSVLYTFATTALVAWFAAQLALRGQTTGAAQPAASDAWRRARPMQTGCLAAALYLLFFSTFRYGRVYLTSAPETFWLALPLWALLAQQLRASIDSARRWSWLPYTLSGLAIGVGCAYKSFALAAPAAATLWCALLLPLGRPDLRTTVRVSLGLAWSTVLALGLFGLWFVLDPDPAAVWQEFVVAENAGKMSSAQGYWHNALFGAYPMWPQLLAYPINAGLLILPTLVWCLQALMRGVRSHAARRHAAVGTLALWLLVWLVVFTVPSQRSERYLIPAMPALAILMALGWERIPAWSFRITALLLLPALAMLARVGWSLHELGAASGLDVAIVLVAASLGFTGATMAFLSKSGVRGATLVTVAAVYASFIAMVNPLSAPEQATYPAAVLTRLQGHQVAVPNGFTGQYERYQFVLPGARTTPYDAEGRNTGALRPDLPAAERLEYLLGRFDAVVWLQDSLTQAQPSCVPRCTVLGARWHIKSRHKAGEITWDNLWFPQQWLFRREWLVVATSRH